MAIVDHRAQLQIRPNPNDVNMLDYVVDYDVIFDEFDRRTNVVYRKNYRIVGVDSRFYSPPEDGENDFVDSFPFFGEISANGATTRHQTDVLTSPRRLADEDQGREPNPDELRVEIRLEPLLPRLTGNATDTVRLNLP